MKPPFFLNVDLEIESNSPLRSLTREFGKRVSVMFSGRVEGRHCLFVEIADTDRSLDGIIRAFCALIEGLSLESKRVWEAAHRKEFDIGYEARLSSQRANHFKVHPSTVRRMAKVGASLAVTFYREEKSDSGGSVNGKSTVRSSSAAGSRQ
jgi:hypothetical protein